MLVAILSVGLAVGAASAQKPVRDWPSQRSGVVDRGDDPPMGRGGECRHEGERIAQGESICIELGGRTYPARCGMSLNNTSWIRQDGTCPN